MPKEKHREWHKEQRWSPNQVRHTAATEIRRKTSHRDRTHHESTRSFHEARGREKMAHDIFRFHS